MPKNIDYHSYLIESLKDPQEAEAYLKGALEEGNLEIIQVARRNVIEAGNGDICRKYQDHLGFVNTSDQGMESKSTHLPSTENKQQDKVRVPDNHGEEVWEVFTILREFHKPIRGRFKRGSKKKKGYESLLHRQSKKVEELLSFNEETLRCAKAEVERQIKDGGILVTILAALGAVVGYSFGAWLQGLVVAYFTLLSFFTYIEISKRYLELSLLEQALVRNNNSSAKSKQ